MISRRVNAERLVLVAWSRAILLQLAHPLVAAGVADHSSFRAGPFEAARRLRHTIRAMLALTFGDSEGQARALDGIRGIHRRVHGRLREPVGPFPAGTPYSAEDPDLVLWVHATLLESLPMAFEAVVAPLTASERDAYCAEAASVAVALGARSVDVPLTTFALHAYLERMHGSGVLAVGRDARALASAVLSPRLSALVWPLGWANRRLTLGWLPEDIRREYGFDWTQGQERQFQSTVRALRRLRRLMPPPLALWPEARRLHKEHAEA